MRLGAVAFDIRAPIFKKKKKCCEKGKTEPLQKKGKKRKKKSMVQLLWVSALILCFQMRFFSLFFIFSPSLFIVAIFATLFF